MPQLFTRIIIVFTLLFACETAIAQRPLTNSRQSSYYTYLYKLTAAEVLAFYESPDDAPNQQLLHNPVDSFRTFASWKNTLPAGNYLRVYAEKNKLNYKLIENRSAYLKLIKNTHELRFVLTDVDGNRIENAKALLNNKVVSFDNRTHSYTAKMANKMLLTVDYAGVTNYYLLNPNSSVFTGFLSRRWFRTHWASLKWLFHKKSEYEDEYENRERLEQIKDYSGFMVFNKPKFKPLDTVKLKAFIIHKGSKKPITAKRLLVRVQDGPDDDGKIVGFVDSYRDGGFEYSFVLNKAITDSLDMTLDDDYYVSLEDPSSIKYKLDDDKGDEDDEKYLSQRKVYAAAKLSYEEYELGSIKFNIRTDPREHQPGMPLAIYLKATDENNLPVADGRAALTLVTSSVQQYKSSKVFVPDTLWQHKFNLDAIGETKVMVPDSIFPRADIDYNINADFWNSNNEHQTSTQYYISYKQSNYKILAELAEDSLKISALQKGINLKTGAKLYTINAYGDTSVATKMALPATMPINRAIKQYIIEIDSTSTNILMSNWDAAPLTDGYHTADSLFVSVKKTRNTPFWYWVFDNNKIISSGEGDSLSYKIKHAGHSNVRVVLNYLWGGEIKSTSFSVPYPDKMLSINVKQPVSVYPGQEVKTEIEVKDARGNPVANADVTAWAITGKFDNYYPPYVPYLGKLYAYKRFRPDVNLKKATSIGESPLNWAKWRKALGLDSIAYYRFMHPTPIYQIEEPAPDSLTQIAPFIVKNGDITPIHVLYIDENPVYFSQAEQLQRYSFAVSPGRHSLRFRTLTQLVLLDSVVVHKGNKLILGITPDTLSSRLIHVTNMPDTLTRYEAALLGKHMIRVVDNFDLRMASIEQNDRLLLLNPVPGRYRHSYNEILAGPLSNNYATFSLRGDNPVPFVTEPDYLYFIEPGFLKQKSVPLKNLFSNSLAVGSPATDYTQYALSRPESDTIWQRYLDLRSYSTQLFKNEPIIGKGTGKFEISINEKVKTAPFIRNIIIYRDGEPDFIRIFPGNTRQFDRLKAGTYRLFFLLEKEKYYIQNAVTIKPNGINFYEVDITPHAKDSVSIKINNIITQRTGGFTPTDMDTHNDALKLMEAFNAAYTNYELFPDVMEGIVVADDDGLPIPGCTVRIKGTNNQVTTSTTGKFSIKVPSSGVLMIKFLGYNEQLVPIQPGRMVKISLSSSFNQLGEVVVTGALGVKRASKDLSYSVTRVSGKDLGGRVLLRGNRSLAGSSGPLIIVDGVPVPGMSMDAIKADSIAEISTLKDAAATAIYGSEASNGVIIINTKKGKRLAATNAGLPQFNDAQTLRKNFSDYAYWQPKLTTDENGKVSFTSTFPDDITNWRTFVIGINGNRQSGSSEKQIKSFKPLSANFIAPQFAVEDDDMNLIGKVMNYNSAPATVNRTFSYNGKVLTQGDLQVSNAKIDTLNIVASATDSLEFEYSIKRDNGYFDGERRKIPVVKQGVLETKGIFEALDRDTTISLKFDPAMGPVTFRAEASALPALAEEAKRLREYKYFCNEQLASKLKGLLAEKRIKTFLGEPFKYERNTLDVIKKLQENRRATGIWGWWKDSDEELWISLHAVEALTDAQSMGYRVQVDKQKLTDYLVYQMESYRGEEKLACLQLLHKLGAKVDYAKYFGLIEKEYKAQKEVLNYNSFRLLLLKQEVGLAIKTDSLLSIAKKTMFGNIYWGEGNYRFFDNSIQLSVIAYKIIKAEGKHAELLAKIRGYFLEQRKLGEWRNTYEAALILETILPDLLQKDKQLKPSVLILKGTATQTVTTFPYVATLNSNAISISKTGSLPIYITGYQQFWNGNPKKVSKDFTVNSWFERNGDKVVSLKGGEAVQLKAEVTVRGDADFVMVEIPIPAGCSYESKDQQWGNNEVHREFFKEKVSIFCRKLKQGTYTFTVNLMPRYSGKYNLNPAKAEQMYFPVFYGREGMKKVVVGN